MIEEIVVMGILSWAIVTCYVLYDNYKLYLKVDNLISERARLLDAIDFNNREHLKTYDQMTKWADELREEVFLLQRQLKETQDADRTIN